MSNLDKNRILWQSRRGMLELDLLLEPFARYRFELLPNDLQQLYCEFLSYEDQDLYAWLLERQEPAKPSFKKLVRLILDYANRSN